MIFGGAIRSWVGVCADYKQAVRRQASHTVDWHGPIANTIKLQAELELGNAHEFIWGVEQSKVLQF